MNLVYLIANKNPRFAKSRSVVKSRVQRNNIVWRGVKVGNDKGRIYLENATECEPFRSRPGSIGWYAQSLGEPTEIITRFVANGKTASKRRITVTKDSFEPIVLPWPVDPITTSLDLEISCGGPAPAFIASHYNLDREVLHARCKGKGVELGPGPNPHIKPTPGTEIFYVEQKTPEEWAKLYGAHYQMGFDPELSPFYIVGEAHDIPVEPESLEFIYSSHVFEHLVNPLGHLEIWSSLLRKGGEVLMIVPDYIGSKDYLAHASTMDEIMAEHRRGSFKPDIAHYRKYADARQTPGKAQKLFDAKSSIHMHYYSNDNMRTLLEHVVKTGLFSSYTILHIDNAKDFHVILVK